MMKHCIRSLKPSADSLERAEQIRELMNMLPTMNQRNLVAIRMRYWQCKSIQEIASALCVSWDEANQLIENGIEYLRDQFKALELEKQLLAAS